MTGRGTNRSSGEQSLLRRIIPIVGVPIMAGLVVIGIAHLVQRFDQDTESYGQRETRPIFRATEEATGRVRLARPNPEKEQEIRAEIIEDVDALPVRPIVSLAPPTGLDSPSIDDEEQAIPDEISDSLKPILPDSASGDSGEDILHILTEPVLLTEEDIVEQGEILSDVSAAVTESLRKNPIQEDILSESEADVDEMPLNELESLTGTGIETAIPETPATTGMPPSMPPVPAALAISENSPETTAPEPLSRPKRLQMEEPDVEEIPALLFESGFLSPHFLTEEMEGEANITLALDEAPSAESLRPGWYEISCQVSEMERTTWRMCSNGRVPMILSLPDRGEMIIIPFDDIIQADSTQKAVSEEALICIDADRADKCARDSICMQRSQHLWNADLCRTHYAAKGQPHFLAVRAPGCMAQRLGDCQE